MTQFDASDPQRSPSRSTGLSPTATSRFRRDRPRAPRLSRRRSRQHARHGARCGLHRTHAARRRLAQPLCHDSRRLRLRHRLVLRERRWKAHRLHQPVPPGGSRGRRSRRLRRIGNIEIIKVHEPVMLKEQVLMLALTKDPRRRRHQRAHWHGALHRAKIPSGSMRSEDVPNML